MTPIRKLYIANRAEIALRIVRTARRLGIATVVPWHAQDRHGPALAEADETAEIHGEPPVAAWLDVDALIRKRDAVSPTGKMGTGWDIAYAVGFLASDESRYINGVLLPVDGGLSCQVIGSTG